MGIGPSGVGGSWLSVLLGCDGWDDVTSASPVSFPLLSARIVTADYKASAELGGEDKLITLGLSPLLHNYKHTPSPTLGYIISALCWDRGTLLAAGKVSTEIAGHPFFDRPRKSRLEEMYAWKFQLWSFSTVLCCIEMCSKMRRKLRKKLEASTIKQSCILYCIKLLTKNTIRWDRKKT